MAVSNPRPNPKGNSRREQAISRRKAAQLIAAHYLKPLTQTNGDENAFEADGYIMSFTKGLHHDENGIRVDSYHTLWNRS